jgi:hypothetical protein
VKEMALTIELSEKAKENLERNQWFRRKESKFITIDVDCYVTLTFDPEKIKQIEKESFGTKVIRYRYIVENVDFKGQEKIFETNWHTSLSIDRYLLQGHRTLKIQRQGTEKETRYIVSTI